MRTAYHEQLSAHNGQLGEMCALATVVMERATQALPTVADLERMSALAFHVAKIARRRHPTLRYPNNSTTTLPRWAVWQ
jgi:phosphate uptake regulator